MTTIKLIKRMCMSIGLLLLAVHCNCDFTQMYDEIKEHADKDDIIDGFFKPELDKMLGNGTYGLVWKGLLDQNKVDARKLHFVNRWKIVAMKCMEGSVYSSFERECKIYTQLLADKNQTVEQYGIPAVWYKGNILRYNLAIGLTYCDVSISDKQEKNHGKLNPINLMVFFYQALKVLKYIHGKEVIHQDLKPDNFMAKGAQLFLVDFNSADFIHDRDCKWGGNRRLASISYFLGIQAYYMDDLKSLYYLMMNFAGVKLPWQGIQIIREIIELRMEFDNVRDLCQQIEPESVRNVLVEFHNKVMINVTNSDDVVEDKRIFDYDTMGNTILDVIEELTKSRIPLFTWLSGKEKEKGKKMFKPIESIAGPRPIDDVQSPTKNNENPSKTFADRVKNIIKKPSTENCITQ